ncbi:putative BcepGomrgp18 [Vibrio coralliirubri]|uniref:hypothetical protein n=1 Tax=Vibrio coralliirubri TaxID=1516159 RepID=UPI000637CD9F|nr:hypothetical protein [Vibrio coralliirubri]CDT54269.1 putative BcepGomrgp18 [Vibrio coralliirubri]
MINDKIQMKGTLLATLVKQDGSVEVTRKDNLIVDVGYDFICNSIGDSKSRPSAMTHIAIGRESQAPAAGDDALIGEVHRLPASYAYKTGSKVFSFTSTFPPGSESQDAIQEAGVFNADTGGIMLDRVVFGVINKGIDDSLTIQFSFTLS